MRSIILAAGFGTRLLPVTEKIPKALVPIVNIPIIDIQADYMKRAGAEAVGINVHHHREMMLSHLNSLKIGIEITAKTEDVILDTGGGLANFRDFIGNEPDFIAYNCDILTDADPLKMMEIHRENDSMATLVLLDNGARNGILVDKNRNILDIAGRLGVEASEGSRLLYGAGIFIYKNEIFRHIPPADSPYPLVPELMKLIKNKTGLVKACIMDELNGPGEAKPYWRDIGSLKSYLEMHRDILETGVFSIPGFKKPENGILIDKSSKIPENTAFSGFASIGEGCSIGRNVELSDIVAISGAIIPKNAKISNSIIFENKVLKTD
ncbi:MAG: NDP-sugar synthase [Firmicutes bacterium]|nr:NDP-sugar synthase [Bacillota bacterium]